MVPGKFEVVPDLPHVVRSQVQRALALRFIQHSRPVVGKPVWGARLEPCPESASQRNAATLAVRQTGLRHRTSGVTTFGCAAPD
jgi:hypothetical protein